MSITAGIAVASPVLGEVLVPVVLLLVVEVVALVDVVLDVEEPDVLEVPEVDSLLVSEEPLVAWVSVVMPSVSVVVVMGLPQISVS